MLISDIKSKKKIKVICFIFLGVISAVISNNIECHYYAILSIREFFVFVCKVISYTFIFVFIEFILKFLISKKKNYYFISFDWTRKSVLITTVLFATVYLTYLLVFYPGTGNYDTTNQIYDLITGDKPLPFAWINGQIEISALMNDHHPILDTLIFTSFYKLGGIFGSYNIGIFFYCLFQLLLTAFSFAIMICSMSTWMENIKNIQMAGVVFLVVAPFVPLYVICMVKDSLFGLLFILYFSFYIMIIKGICKKEYLVIIVVLSLLLSLTKKTGIYQVMITNFVLIFSNHIRNKRRRVAFLSAGTAISFLIVFFVLPKMIFPVFNIYSGGKQESIGFAIQQVSRVVYDYKDELSEKEIDIINKIVTVENIIDNYKYDNVDGVKDFYNYYATSEEVVSFMKLWVELGIKYPGTYFKSISETTGYFFIPSREISVYRMIPANSLGIGNPEELAPFRETVIAVYSFLCKLPGINLFFTMAIYCFIVPMIVFINAIIGKDMNNIMCLIPILVSILILVICPLAYGRYSLILFYSLPIIIGIYNDVMRKV